MLGALQRLPCMGKGWRYCALVGSALGSLGPDVGRVWEPWGPHGNRGCLLGPCRHPEVVAQTCPEALSVRAAIGGPKTTSHRPGLEQLYGARSGHHHCSAPSLLHHEGMDGWMDRQARGMDKAFSPHQV